MAIGIRGVVIDAGRTHPVDFAKWFVGSVVAHDAVLAPIVLAIGVIAGRAVPRVVRRPVQFVLIVGGVVALYAFPLVRGWGRRPDNPTLQPGSYVPALLTVLAIVAAVATAWAVIAAARARTRPSRTRSSPQP